LSNAVLDPPPLCQIGDLGPVLIRVCGAAEGAAGPVGSYVSRGRGRRVRVALSGHVGQRDNGIREGMFTGVDDTLEKLYVITRLWREDSSGAWLEIYIWFDGLYPDGPAE
jgi:hypothetical protein